ncbi:MAG: hypothetical protein H5T86_06145, partial [Armatimonadetes bacterium]|nr:hypothetical protein [Armatimonadota bacterium]
MEAGLAGQKGMLQPRGQDADRGPVRFRVFWTWDHSTTWALNRPGGHDIGTSNAYDRTTETFIADYTSLLRWAGAHGIDAVIVWGLLRERHGGVDAGKKLCDVAHESGVKLLAGVGLNAYGGVYYEGQSPWSLDNHLNAHPDLYALCSPDGPPMILDLGPCSTKPAHHACPSRPENQEFAQESLAWLFETVPLDGVQMETGDTGVCQCSLCQARRQYPVSAFSLEDMALMYPLAAEAIRSVKPDALIIAETYSHPEPYDGPLPAPGFGEGAPAWLAECLAAFPENIMVNWVCDNFVPPRNARAWTDAGRPPAGGGRLHIMRAHFGTYWHRYRDELCIDWIADMVATSLAHGFEGFSIFGESSPFHTGAELNYLAFADYGSPENPGSDLDSFLERVAAPLLGGPDLAREYLCLARAI